MGRGCPSTGSGTLPVTNSTTEEVMGTVPEGTAADVDEAVAAARQAFPAWAATSVEERAKYCARIAEGLAARMDEIATLVSQEVGHGQAAEPGRPGRPAATTRSTSSAQLVESTSPSRRRSATR